MELVRTTRQGHCGHVSSEGRGSDGRLEDMSMARVTGEV